MFGATLLGSLAAVGLLVLAVWQLPRAVKAAQDVGGLLAQVRSVNSDLVLELRVWWLSEHLEGAVARILDSHTPTGHLRPRHTIEQLLALEPESALPMVRSIAGLPVFDSRGRPRQPLTLPPDPLAAAVTEIRAYLDRLREEAQANELARAERRDTGEGWAGTTDV